MKPSDRLGARVGESTLRLSLAVRPLDAYTGVKPNEPLRVRLTDHPARPTVSPSRDYLFVDLNVEDPQTVVVTGSDDYLPTNETVMLADLDPLAPVLPVTLYPSPAYPFPAWETLVRGRVLVPNGDAGDAVEDATVSLSGLTSTGQTDDRGEFAVAVTDVGTTDVIDQDGRRLVAPDGDPLVVTATHTTHGTASESVTVEEGGLAVVTLSLE